MSANDTWLDKYFANPDTLYGDENNTATVSASKTQVTANSTFGVPFTEQQYLSLTTSSQSVAYDLYTIPSSTVAKVNVAVTAGNSSDGASWDISFLLQRHATGNASIIGNAYTTASGDNYSSGAIGWLAGIDISSNKPRVLVTAANGVTVGVVVQVIPVVTA